MSTRRSGYYSTSYARDLSLFDTPYRKAAIGLLLLAGLVAPMVASQSILHLVNLTMIAIIGALALNLLTGFAGQLSLGHAAFLAVGGYLSHFFSTLDLPFIVVVPAVMVVGSVIGFLVGAPALRLRGLYLVLATVGFHYIALFVIHVYQSSGEKSILALTGFLLPTVDFGIFKLDATFKWTYCLGFFLLLTTAFCINLTRTRIVRAWIALRERDITAAALGINVPLYKLKAFVVSTSLTCMAGALLVYYLGAVSSENYTLDLAVSYLAMVVIGGAGSVLGSYLGAIFVAVMPFLITGLFELVQAGPRFQLRYIVPSQIVAFGLLMIMFLVFEPRGIVGIWRRIRVYFELWPLRRSILSERRD